MHIAVCDDSAFDRELIVELLHIYLAQKPFQYKLAQYNSGINLVCDVEAVSYTQLQTAEAGPLTRSRLTACRKRPFSTAS